MTTVVVKGPMDAPFATSSRFLVVCLLVLAFAVPAFSAAQAEPDRSRDGPREQWRVLAQGKKDFKISDLARVPNSLKLAADYSRCEYSKGIQVEPIHFLETENRLVAIVTCWGPIFSRQQAFDLSDRHLVKTLQFPMVAEPEGFSTSVVAPGLVVWEKETGLFRSEATSDVIGDPRTRYTYRLDTDGFVVLRVEYQPVGAEWTTLWKAPRWTDLTKRH